MSVSEMVGGLQQRDVCLNSVATHEQGWLRQVRRPYDPKVSRAFPSTPRALHTSYDSIH